MLKWLFRLLLQDHDWDWYPCGKGLLMCRRVDGERQYRPATEAEEAEYMSASAW